MHDLAHGDACDETLDEGVSGELSSFASKVESTPRERPGEMMQRSKSAIASNEATPQSLPETVQMDTPQSFMEASAESRKSNPEELLMQDHLDNLLGNIEDDLDNEEFLLTDNELLNQAEFMV
mmetsp:Transcript_44979/g.59687  ORF Transcript_44979/g.59687 Transcript_44979/m.59687 type:complete len:123 (-) Transcript_44979:1569-1937(-)|eukprot:CAMPEP_0185593710 /NCGR_PEP_ID=MMETSP0434-20130131/72335_1 /TAXON_ID=626734 ORGANISM="Favella taraikaensis, Strain Fe Narragansett Bay" /NCGR_SAMPLE_ID=MMETSP0434 /ASSEMBLY_ACC=CAM_ASM_000379 /LENGTH=122 /DNA_ID=CAMNT_0028220495 /DNA_START=492 /DNA_END=860 /DNA_ORIENTATION=-